MILSGLFKLNSFLTGGAVKGDRKFLFYSIPSKFFPVAIVKLGLFGLFLGVGSMFSIVREFTLWFYNLTLMSFREPFDRAISTFFDV